ncbi:protein SAR DEFICIENT 1-like isoform X2 [Mercurialis annua]|uniref:protein SAR DEFICIENT 1-like isoform X2 n=1 Tax=Mercurialis annua TaxID=3986 RepID=UPI00215F8ABA|nr:protein SAR DEFICIENT 1-like isoform X2 [Mercurialis annua]
MSLHMAAKRFLDEPASDPTDHKRPRTRPSSTSGAHVMVNSVQNFCSILEPMLRKVVNEEMEITLNRLRVRSFTRSPSLQIRAPEPSPSRLQLIFKEKLLLPIFTGSKIVDINGNSLQIQLVDTTEDGVKIPTSLTHPVKLEVVVLDGDFPSDDRATWTSEEFDNKIVKERTGKRPLLAGDCLTVTLRDGIAGIGDVEFTDNSSWIRGRKFRVGARVVLGSSQGVMIREAMSDAFVVKDHRGELYKKHYPPMLNDEVWRLEKIGKDGAFHKKLSASNIENVQDFLKLSIVDKSKLKTILGNGMSEKMWEVTLKHARTCEMGNKHYIFNEHNFTVTLNPICQIMNAIIDGQAYSTQDLPTINRSYIENLARQAYAKWSSLEEIIAVSSENLVDQYSNDHHQAMVKSYHQIDHSSERYFEMGDQINDTDMGYFNWNHDEPINPGIRYDLSESSSGLIPGSFI